VLLLDVPHEVGMDTFLLAIIMLMYPTPSSLAKGKWRNSKTWTLGSTVTDFITGITTVGRVFGCGHFI
jgi:hypothetical protein